MPVFNIRRSKPSNQPGHEQLIQLIGHVRAGEMGRRVPIRRYEPRELFVQEDELIMCGTFGKVYRGTYINEPVTVKFLDWNGVSHKTKADFEQELLIHQALSRDFVAELFGSWIRARECSVVIERGVGNIADWLHGNVPALPNTTTTKLYLIFSVACALEYLHSLGIVHQNINPFNCMINSDLKVKLTGFGADVIKVDNTEQLGIMLGGANDIPVYYIAPELWEGEQYGPASDTYAFAVLMNEIMTEKAPFVEVQNIYSIGDLVVEGRRPVLMEATTETEACVKRLIETSWVQQPTERPAMEEIVTSLQFL